MANEPKMKIGIGADTGDFDKGAKKVKQEMKDLSKVSSDAFGVIGAAVGADTGKLMQMGSALNGLGAKFQQSGNAGVAAFGSILKAIDPVSLAIAGLGVGTLVTAFKDLKSAAEEYNNTVEGSIQRTASLAYIDTYNAAIRQATGAGKKLAEFEQEWREFAGSFWTDIGLYFSSGSWYEDLDLFGWFTDGSNHREMIKTMSDAISKAEQARSITKLIAEKERERKENAIEIAKIDADIADKMAIARDVSQSLEDRNKAISEIEDLINNKKNLSVQLEKDLALLYSRRSSLVTDSVEAADATLAQQQRAWQTERNIQVELNGLLRVKNQITNSTKKEAADAAAAAVKAAKEWDATWKKMGEDLEAEMERMDEFKHHLQLRSGGLIMPDNILQGRVELPVKLAKPSDDELQQYTNFFSMGIGPVKLRFMTEDLDKAKAKIIDISKEIENTIKSGITGMAEAVGDMLAAFTNGEKGWKAFASSALSALGDMAIGVGKIAIETGVAMLGIKAALETLGTAGPYVAIAAGAALVALGTWAKSSLSNVANGGNYSSSASTVTSSAASYDGNFEQRDVYVNVQGTLVADGDQLVAVLNNTDRKNQFTT